MDYIDLEQFSIFLPEYMSERCLGNHFVLNLYLFFLDISPTVLHFAQVF